VEEVPGLAAPEAAKPKELEAPPTAPTVELTPEQREFLEALNSLILSAQELSYTVALLPNELVETHSELRDLVEAARNVVRSVYRFHKLVKRRAPR